MRGASKAAGGAMEVDDAGAYCKNEDAAAEAEAEVDRGDARLRRVMGVHFKMSTKQKKKLRKESFQRRTGVEKGRI